MDKPLSTCGVLVQFVHAVTHSIVCYVCESVQFVDKPLSTCGVLVHYLHAIRHNLVFKSVQYLENIYLNIYV